MRLRIPLLHERAGRAGQRGRGMFGNEDFGQLRGIRGLIGNEARDPERRIASRPGTSACWQSREHETSSRSEPCSETKIGIRSAGVRQTGLRGTPVIGALVPTPRSEAKLALDLRFHQPHGVLLAGIRHLCDPAKAILLVGQEVADARHASTHHMTRAFCKLEAQHLRWVGGIPRHRLPSGARAPPNDRRPHGDRAAPERHQRCVRVVFGVPFGVRQRSNASILLNKKLAATGREGGRPDPHIPARRGGVASSC